MLGMKNHFDISDSIEIREVDIVGVACIRCCRSLNDSSLTILLLLSGFNESL